MSIKLVIRWRPLALFVLALLGLALRLYGLNWDQGSSFHPDERQILFRVIPLSWPSSFAQFLNPAASPLNPHFFSYGSFPLYLLALLGHLFLHSSFPTLTSPLGDLALIGRAVSAIFDSGTILLTGWLALLLTPDHSPGRRYAWSVALLAAALIAVTPFQLQLAHFYAVDSMLLFFVMLTIASCLKLVNTERFLLWSAITGISYGLALATKFSAAPLAVPIFVAILLRWYQQRDLYSTITVLSFTSLVTVLVFFIAQPYALLDLPSFIDDVTQQGSLVRGTFDLPYVRQFTGTIPVVYQVQNMVLWGMGLALGLAAFAGLFWLLWRVWKRDAGLWLVVHSWVLFYSAITCTFYVKFMRYMLPVYPLLTLMAASALLALARSRWPFDVNANAWMRRSAAVLRYALIALVLTGTIFQGLALLNVYSQPNTRIQASLWIYNHLQPGSVLTYEQWDDPLPVAVGDRSPAEYIEATSPDGDGNPVMGLDLYSDDTMAKARQLANILPTVNAITMATDRLDKSIPHLPFRYPLTIRYYQLLFSGQLGFRLAATFQNRPHLLGITLDDSNADESYSVFDHPTSRIFVRENPYPYTSDQLFKKLLDGVQLPPPAAHLTGDQRALLLTPQQIADDQQSPPFAVQFPANSLSNNAPILVWWLALALLGLFVYPLVFSAFAALSDRGYLFGKTLAILLLAYLAWLLASAHIAPFSRLSLLLVSGALAIAGFVAFLLQRRAITAFLRHHWRVLLLAEALFSAAFLLLVAIRAFNPDLWSVYRGGEKPMEMAFLNAVLRSPYMPPLDPWFSGGYINYYYYGYVIIGALIKLTGIVPTIAFNLAIPTLFAATFSGAVIILYSFTRRLPISLLGGYFTAFIGNLDGLAQLRSQLAALLVHVQPPPFDYWQSSRIIPFTINEFPFWSFLFADLHPHVIDMPIALFMLGILATFLLSTTGVGASFTSPPPAPHTVLYLITAFVLGSLACVNPWDMPVYALLLAAVLIIGVFQEKKCVPGGSLFSLFPPLAFRLLTLLLLYGLAYLFYLPFYASYQQLYVNGLGPVQQSTNPADFFTISGLWIFLALSLFLLELYRRWTMHQGKAKLPGIHLSLPGWASSASILLCSILFIALALLNLKAFLAASLALGAYLCILSLKDQLALPQPQTTTHSTGALNGAAAAVPAPASTISLVKTRNQGQIYTYLLLLMALAISLGIELVYIRDFLDDTDYARMNTFFKFSLQAWLCFALAGALVVQRMWHTLRGFGRRLWMTTLTALMLGCSVFLVSGTATRIGDHQLWVNGQPPAYSANYTPSLDGFAFVRSWYPADAAAIDWLNANVSGSPVILEATVPISYQWYNRVSVYTGLPDVLGWPDHVSEQRYQEQVISRMTDIGIIYSTPDPSQAIALLRYYHVRYVYIGPLERTVYAPQSSASLDKFAHMPDLHPVYRSAAVTIYEVT